VAPLAPSTSLPLSSQIGVTLKSPQREVHHTSTHTAWELFHLSVLLLSYWDWDSCLSALAKVIIILDFMVICGGGGVEKKGGVVFEADYFALLI